MNRIKELRKEKGKTLDEMERETGIKRGSINNYENKKSQPRMETWQKLAFYFDVPVEYLMGVSDHRYSVNTLDWLHQYANEQKHYKKDSIIAKTSLNTNDLIGAAMDILEKSKQPSDFIIGDEKETEKILLSAGQRLLSENFFKNTNDTFKKSLQKLMSLGDNPIDQNSVAQFIQGISNIMNANPRDTGDYANWFERLGSFIKDYKNLSPQEREQKKVGLTNELNKLIDQTDKKIDTPFGKY